MGGVSYVTEPPDGAITLAVLKAKVRELSEQEAAVVLEGQDEAGNRVVSMVRRDVKRVDHLGLDAHVELRIPFGSTREDGLCDDVEADQLRARPDQSLVIIRISPSTLREREQTQSDGVGARGAIGHVRRRRRCTAHPLGSGFAEVEITGVTDPDSDPVDITIDSVFQDEPVCGLLDPCPDAQGVGTDTLEIRKQALILGLIGNGRVYHVEFTADDGNGGSCQGEVTVGAKPLISSPTPVDDGPSYDSTTD